MPFVRRAANRIRDECDRVPEIDRPQDRCKHADICLGTGNDKSVRVPLAQAAKQRWLRERRISRLIDDGGRRH
jgi:hypothetical protein